MMKMMMMKSRSSNSSSKEESTMTEEDLLEKKPSLDPQLWHACAGGMVQMPAVDTRVYYYPQGHAEHAATPPDFESLHKRIPSTILCRVLSVKYLADTETDEVYARMRLVPVPGEDCHFDDNSQDNNRQPSQNPQLAARNANGVSGPSSFAKTLTQSDANNGGGFSVPRYCAETIFPRLDYSSEPPVQTVLARDVHGEVWKFRHIYRGTPRRHLLTTGWSTFVNQKKLVAGDAIVFLRSASGELCVGVRRSTRNNTNSSGLSDLSPPSWHLPPSYRTHSRWELKSPSETVSSGFSRNRGRVSAKSVLEAASRAASGQPFEVVYYPRASTPEFCVKARSVKLAMGMHWSPGMRFKMAFETEDSSRISWFMGTISSVQLADPVHWPNSPWRLLQVTWDEPDILQNVKRVSPWLVELVSTMPPIQMTPFTLPKKKLRVTQPPEFQLENRSIMELQMGSTLGNNLLRQFNPWQSVSESVPAGMQGARQDRFYGFSLPDFCINKSSPGLFVTNPARQEQVAATAHVSTELNIGNSYQHEAADMQSSISCLLSVGNSAATQQKADDGWSKNSKAMNGASFLLFGKPIHAGESPKSNVTTSTVDGNFVEGWKKSSSIAGNNDVLQRVQQLMAGKKDINNFSDNSVSWFYNGESLDSTGANSTTTFNWVNDQSSATKLEKDSEESTTEDNTVHCKVFKETEEVGRTLDLSLFGTYEQLYDKLAKMFGVNVSELLNRVLYKGLSGSVRHAGDEPYKDFMKNVRRLTILSETGSDNMAR